MTELKHGIEDKKFPDRWCSILASAQTRSHATEAVTQAGLAAFEQILNLVLIQHRMNRVFL
jgi:hypothetical protein